MTVIAASTTRASRPSTLAAASTVLLYLVVAIVMILAVFPFYWLVTHVGQAGRISWRPTRRSCFRRVFTLQNYVDVMHAEDIGRFAVNSIVISLVSTALTVFMGSMAAYALAKSYLPYACGTALLLDSRHADLSADHHRDSVLRGRCASSSCPTPTRR